MNIAKGLKYRVNVGVDFYDNKYNNYYGSNTQFKEGGLNTGQIQNSDNLSWTVENLVTYEKTFAEKHRMSFTGMYSAQESEFTSSRFNLTNVAADYLQYNNASLAETVEAPTNDNNTRTWGLLSYMGTESSLLLNSTNIYPELLLNAGFSFEFGDIDAAIADLIHSK